MINKLTIKDGIIQDKFIDGIPIKIQIVEPKGKTNVRTLIKMKEYLGVTNHNTGNSSPTASDEAHAKWLQNVENADQVYVSVHFFVDQDSITQTVPLDEVTYHAGDGTGDGNYKTISVEICENANVSLAEENAKKLNAALILTYPTWKIFKHQDWSGKYCPRVILNRKNGWVDFVNGIQSYVAASKVTDEPTTGTPIMGKSECEAKQLELYLLANNKEPKLSIGTKEFCELWIAEGNIEGVKGDVAFCQACHETGFFKYGGQVLPEQNNYGGIGATNNSATGKGAWFGYPQMGVRASIQHLKAYASKEQLKQECVDPRYHLVTKGVAPTFEDLGGRWAVPGFDKAKYKTIDEAKAAKASYGDAIIKKFNLLKLMIVPMMPDVSDWALPGYEWAVDNGITDGDRPKDAVTREELWTMMYRAYALTK